MRCATGLNDPLGIPDGAWRDRRSDPGRRGEPSLYGRLDLRWDGTGPPKLLEYNADTPTALFEAAVVQWEWLQCLEDGAARHDQFNSLHEALIAAWRALGLPARVHFCCDARQRRGPRHGRLPARHRDAGRARGALPRDGRDRLERARLHRPRGTARSRRCSSSIPGTGCCGRHFGANIAEGADPLDRARLAADPVLQGLPVAAVAPVPGPSEPAGRASGAGADRRARDLEADLRAGGGEHRRPGDRDRRAPMPTSRGSGRTMPNCRASAGATRCSGPGSWPASRRASASARTPRPSPATPAASCRTCSTEGDHHDQPRDPARLPHAFRRRHRAGLAGGWVYARITPQDEVGLIRAGQYAPPRSPWRAR